MIDCVRKQGGATKTLEGKQAAVDECGYVLTDQARSDVKCEKPLQFGQGRQWREQRPEEDEALHATIAEQLHRTNVVGVHSYMRIACHPRSRELEPREPVAFNLRVHA